MKLNNTQLLWITGRNNYSCEQFLVDSVIIVVYFYTNIAAKDYEIPRDMITLGQTIGHGQFGDVHRGTYQTAVSVQ